MLRRLLKIPLYWQVLAALILAVFVGHFSADATIGQIKWLDVYAFVGDLFLRALKMLIVPLISSAIITGVSSLGAEHAFGRLGLKTLAYYLTTSVAAILVGLLLVNLIKPGLSSGQPIGLGATSSEALQEAQEKIAGKGAGDVVDVFKRMIPENVVAASSSNGEMLALIVFSVLFGYYMSRIQGKPAHALQSFWQGVYDVMIRITDLVMKFTPIGVFGLVANVAATTDPKDFLNLFAFFLTVLGGLCFHFLVTLPLLMLLIAKVKPWRHYRAMFPALLTAFSTSSSSATLPVTLECLQKNAKVSRRTSSFVIPLGATINMDGTALYECAAAMFIAQAAGIQITFFVQFLVVLLALLTSIGVAGVPQASLVAIVIILTAIGLPSEGIGLILLFDRPLDMCRTAVNVFSDSCGAVIIAKSEGETQVLSN